MAPQVLRADNLCETSSAPETDEPRPGRTEDTNGDHTQALHLNGFAAAESAGEKKMTLADRRHESRRLRTSSKSTSSGDLMPADRAAAGKSTSSEAKEDKPDDAHEAAGDTPADPIFPDCWPSERPRSTRLELARLNHRVYSLRDYSQISSPTTCQVSPSNRSLVSTTAGRLLKSMSLDRRIRPVSLRAKRPTADKQAAGKEQQATTPTSLSRSFPVNKQQRKFLLAAKTPMSTSLSIEPSTSVTSLLPNSSNCSKGITPLSESRINRVRKLFVSPLAARSVEYSAGAANSSGLSPRSLLVYSRLGGGAGGNRLDRKHNGRLPSGTMYPTHLYHDRKSAGKRHPSSSAARAVYGCPLQLANKMYPITCFGKSEIYKQKSIPYILARLCNHIEENSASLTHEGIFRVSGNARLMDKLRLLFDRLGDAPLESESVDVATSASMLKLYLRELPEPLIPTRMNYHFIALARKYSSTVLMRERHFETSASNKRDRPNHQPEFKASRGCSLMDRQRGAYLRATSKLLRKLPIDNYNLLKYLACFLYRITLKQEHNRMCSGALGIVFGPNIFRIRSESYKGLKEQELANLIIASVIGNYKNLFDCQIMDPLGNLITSDSDCAKQPPHERDQTTAPVTTCPQQSGDTTQHRDQEEQKSATKPVLRPSNSEEETPDSSSSRASVLTTKEQAGARAPASQRQSDTNEDCDDDSISPLTSISSYCSSVNDTASYESSLDKEGSMDDSLHEENYNDEERVTGSINLGSSLSSICDSDSNCTPAHSESDESRASSLDLSSAIVVGKKSQARNAAGATCSQERQSRLKVCEDCKMKRSSK